jgi:hypothetical protein
MATYAELRLASEDPTLRLKITVACIVSAEVIRSEDVATTNHTNRLAWAKKVFENPDAEAKRMIWAVLAQNRAASYSAIISASDATVQSAVDAEVNMFATGS